MPTFYAHYQSKEHLVMQLPRQRSSPPSSPTSRPTCRWPSGSDGAVPVWLAHWTPEYPRGRRSPAGGSSRPRRRLRIRAAEFERATAELVYRRAARREPGSDTRPADAIVVNAYLSAYTAGILAWADCNGERKLEELVEEAFDALRAVAERPAISRGGPQLDHGDLGRGADPHRRAPVAGARRHVELGVAVPRQPSTAGWSRRMT